MTALDRCATSDLLAQAEGLASDLEFTLKVISARLPNDVHVAAALLRAQAAYRVVLQAQGEDGHESL